MTGEPFGIESSAGTRPGLQILRVSGPLNLETEFKFLEQVRAETAPVVILDLSSVHYSDSRGVAALVQIYDAFKKESRRLALVGLNERVLRPLEIMHIRPLFTVFASVEEAEAGLI
jgi:anti-anti-sigma factor